MSLWQLFFFFFDKIYKEHTTHNDWHVGVQSLNWSERFSRKIWKITWIMVVIGKGGRGEGILLMIWWWRRRDYHFEEITIFFYELCRYNYDYTSFNFRYFRYSYSSFFRKFFFSMIFMLCLCVCLFVSCSFVWIFNKSTEEEVLLQNFCSSF